MKFSRMIMFLVLWGLICPGLLHGQEQQNAPASANQDRIKEEISKRWDISSDKYDSRPGHGVQSEEEAEAWRELFRKLMVGNGLRILDAGCGTGEMSFLLAELGHEVYGLDISKNMLAKAEEKAKTKAGSAGGRPIRFQWGDAENPPFEPGFFDVVFCRHVLWTLPSPQTALDSWTKILKDNGKIVVIDALWDDGSLSTRVRRKVGGWLRYVFEKENLPKSHYSPAVEAALPHAGGVPLDKARAYMQQAGLQDLQDTKLDRLGDIQRQHMPFWYRVIYKNAYYAICGHKRSQ